MSETGPIETYLEGVTVRVSAVLTDFNGAAVNISGIRLLVRQPGATTSALVAISSVSGAAVGFIVASVPGTWRYRFETIAAPFVAFEGMFHVARRRVPPPT